MRLVKNTILALFIQIFILSNIFAATQAAHTPQNRIPPEHHSTILSSMHNHDPSGISSLVLALIIVLLLLCSH